MAPTRMETLRREVEYLTGRVDRLAAIKEFVAHACDTRTNEVNDLLIELKETRKDMMKLCSDEDAQTFNQIFIDTEVKLMGVLEKIRAASPPNYPPLSPQPILNTNVEVKLPRLDLPVFNGSPGTWTTFSSLFADAMSQYTSITGSQKLLLLLNCLSGPAKALISYMPASEESFKEAWDILQKKYENKRKSAYDLVLRVINHPSVKSSAEIEELVDNTRETIRALSVLKLESPPVWVNPTLLQKVEPEVRFAYEQKQEHNVIPKTADLLDFLQTWATSCAVTQKSEEGNNPKSTNHSQPSGASNRPFTRQCPLCQLPHHLSRCPSFCKASVEDRWKEVKRLRLCSNCLKSNHVAADCSGAACPHCAKKHHGHLHRDAAAVEAKVTASTTADTKQVLLATALVYIDDNKGEPRCLRALLDGGSQLSLITKRSCENLQCKPVNMETSITNALGQQDTIGTAVETVIKDSKGVFSSPIVLHCVPVVASTLPSSTIDTSRLQNFINSHTLADPKFFEPSQIDLLLGADVLSAIYNQENEICDGLFMQNTKLGWILFGSVQQPPSRQHVVSNVMLNSLKQFWELEELPKKTILSREEKEVEEFMEITMQRTDDGRFKVRLPVTDQELGYSRKRAADRLTALEQRFKKHPDFASHYREVIDDYIHKGHLEPAPTETTRPTCYIPHHAVLKPGSTTSLRVVFDGSAKTTNGLSLNEVMKNGPRLQPDLFNILLQFRTHKVAITADIVQMYRQIWVHEDDRDLQRILWRPTPNSAVRDFRLTTVTFGEKAAPYAAVKCLRAVGHKTEDQSTRSAILNEFYVDDLLTGAETVQEAVQLQRNITTQLATAGFTMHKWASNQAEALEFVSKEMKASTNTCSIGGPDEFKTLGMLWNTSSDTFTILAKPDMHKVWTRRKVLSVAHSLYDPLGLVSPVFTTAKKILRELVKNNNEWDSMLPDNLQQLWLSWIGQLPELTKCAIPRWIPTINYELMCFSDASEIAYSATIYVRSTSLSGTKIRLVAAKSKLVPLKPVTVPRLELLGAVLLIRLLKTVKKTLPSPSAVKCFTDSTITLAWIQGDPARWTTFVAHRVTEINDEVSPDCWQHVKSEDNPADLSSRGVTANVLAESTLWWQGPTWLQETTDSPSKPESVNPPEERKHKLVAALTKVTYNSSWMLKFSSFAKLRRIMALVFHAVLRFQKKTGNIVEASTYEKAENFIFKMVQQKAFPQEVAALQHGQEITMKSPLAPLAPFISEDHVIRVGGRLRKSKLPLRTKHQLVLLSRSHVTTLLVRDAHEELLHAGPSAVETHLRQNYWIMHSASTIKRILRRCVRCARCKAQMAKQMMADLPSARVTPSRPFTNCGIDYAGPFKLKSQLVRGPRIYQGYIALFVCFSTRAIHLELVTALSTAAFLAAFSRFASRRGLPRHVYSDNGTNLVGAEKQLRIFSGDTIVNNVTEQGITWHFNPPGAPHFGGLWEAGVKSVKYHLKRVVGTTTLTYEEFSTVLCRTEAAVNSRPLIPLSSDPESLEALTPAHFLVGGPLQAVPEEDLQNSKLTTLQRWDMVRQISQQIWKRWSKEYLTRLQNRPKWWRKAPNLQKGALVLIEDPNRPSLCWRLARIIDIHPGSDGAARVATLKTEHGEMKRPIHKLCPLPMDGDKDEDESKED